MISIVLVKYTIFILSISSIAKTWHNRKTGNNAFVFTHCHAAVFVFSVLLQIVLLLLLCVTDTLTVLKAVTICLLIYKCCLLLYYYQTPWPFLLYSLSLVHTAVLLFLAVFLFLF